MWPLHDVDRAAGWAWLLQALVSLACLSDRTSGGAASGKEASADTYQERSFSDILVDRKKVTCDEFEPKYYSVPIFTCKNMRIGGHRLRYWVGPGVQGNYHCGIKMDQWKARNDLGALCHHLMHIQGIKHKLWAAVVSEASCEVSPGTRLLFVKKDEQPNGLDDKQSDKRIARGPSHVWEEFEEGRGYVVTFRCMMLPEQ